MLERYKEWLVITGSLVTVICGIVFPQALIGGGFVVATVCAAIIAAWWYSYKYLKKSGRYSIILSLIPVFFVWLAQVWAFIYRIQFTNKYGLEGPHPERSSPMAALIGIYAQVALLIPTTVTLIIGIITLIIETADQKKLNKSNIHSD